MVNQAYWSDWDDPTQWPTTSSVVVGGAAGADVVVVVAVVVDVGVVAQVAGRERVKRRQWEQQAIGFFSTEEEDQSQTEKVCAMKKLRVLVHDGSLMSYLEK